MVDNISAKFVSSKADRKEVVLYLTMNSSQLDLAISSVAGSRYEYVIYMHDSAFFHEVLRSKKVGDNVRLCSDYKTIQMLLLGFSAVITTVGHLSPTLSLGVLSILKSCVSVGLPVLEVPHGLFQWGYGFEDDSKVVHAVSNIYGAGMAVPTFADFQMSWFGPDGVGYPRSDSTACSRDIVTPNYTVITTNTNWYMYGYSCQRVLMQTIFEFARRRPDELFIWCPHPAELAGEGLVSAMSVAKPSNIYIYGLGKDIYFHSIDTTEAVIAHSVRGISTISSCLVDYELHGKPVAVFVNDGLLQVAGSLDYVSLFDSVCALDDESFQCVKTGRLKRFDVTLFDDKLAAVFKHVPGDTAARRLISSV